MAMALKILDGVIILHCKEQIDMVYSNIIYVIKYTNSQQLTSDVY